MRLTVLAFAAVAVFGTLPAVAQTPSDAATPAAAPAPKEKKSCRRIDLTGSIVPKAECHTKAEWARIDSANTQSAGDMLGNTRSPSTERR